MSKDLKLAILNRAIDMLPKTFTDYEDGSISMYVCDVIHEITFEIGDHAIDVCANLTNYIHELIGKKTFSVFEFLNIDGIGQIDEEDYQKAYDFRINMLKEMIEKVEKGEL